MTWTIAFQPTKQIKIRPHPHHLLNPNNAFSIGQGLSNYETNNGGQHTNKFHHDHEDRLLGVESSCNIAIGYQYEGNGNLLRQYCGYLRL